MTDPHSPACLGGVQQLADAHVLAVLSQVKLDLLVQLLLLLSDFSHVLVHTRHLDPPLLVHQGAWVDTL